MPQLRALYIALKTMPLRAAALSVFGVLLLLTATSAYVAPHDRYFVGNFAWYWLPVVVVVLIGVALGVVPSISAGGGIALALFLAAFHSWVASLGRGADMAWLGYLFAMPGAATGLLVAGWLAKRESSGALASLFIALAATAAGLALNVGVLCNTVMYCHG